MTGLLLSERGSKQHLLILQDNACYSQLSFWLLNVAFKCASASTHQCIVFSTFTCPPRHGVRPQPELGHIAPKVANEGHRRIVERVLPVLAQVMSEPAWTNQPLLLQARETLWRVELAGDKFWGAHMNFSRKRTVEDVIVSRYHSDVRLSLL